MTRLVSIAGDTVDMMCRRHYGAEVGYCEAVYTANPGLAALGAILPAGVVIVAPDVAPPVQRDAVVRLWD